MFLVCSNRGMTDRPASWRMPTPKQMEKLAAAVGKEPRRTPTPGPGDEMPPEYWQAVLDDPHADASPMTPGPSDPDAAAVRNSPACAAGRLLAAAAGPSRSRRPMPSGSTGPRRSGRTSDSACWTTPASSGPAATKRTAAGPRSSSRRRAAGPLPESWMSGWRRNITPRPSPEATARL